MDAQVAVSEPMRAFVVSRPSADISVYISALAKVWPNRRQQRGVAQILDLLWPAGLRLYHAEPDPTRSLINAISGGLDLDGAILTRLAISVSDKPASIPGARFNEAVLSHVDLSDAVLTRAQFGDAILENVNLSYANIDYASFAGVLLSDVNMTGTTLQAASFRRLDRDSSVLLFKDAGADGVLVSRLVGADAVNGFLSFFGAETDPVSNYDTYIHDPRFPIVEKISRKLAEQGQRQVRGLVQRGAAQRDVAFARSFLEFLEREGIAARPAAHRQLVGATPFGREVLAGLVEHRELPDTFVGFILANPS